MKNKFSSLFLLGLLFSVGLADVSFAANRSDDVETSDVSNSSPPKKNIEKPTTSMTCSSTQDCCSRTGSGNCIMCAKKGECPKS